MRIRTHRSHIGERSDFLPYVALARLARLNTVCVQCGAKATEKRHGELSCGNVVCGRQINQVHKSRVLAETLKSRKGQRVA